MHILVLVFMLLQALAAAHPTRPLVRRFDGHPHAPRHGLVKRATIVVTDERFAVPTQDSEVVIYVNQFGKAILTETDTVIIIPATSSLAKPTEAPAPVTVETSPDINSANTITSYGPTATNALDAADTFAPATSTESPESHPVVSPLPSTSTLDVPPVSFSIPTVTNSLMPASTISSHGEASSSPSPLPMPAPGPLRRNGISYSPYKHSQLCKSVAEIEADLAIFASNYTSIRLYGLDCDQVSKVYQASRKYGNMLIIGIWNVDTIEQSVAAIASGVRGDWDAVDMITIGNERVTNGQSTVPQMLEAVSQTRHALRLAGYEGPVSTVDTCGTVLANPVLCDASDICTVNVHPFFDSNTPATRAGSFIIESLAQLRTKLADPNQRIVVVESGYPWNGTRNGVAVPSLENQAIAVAQIIKAVSNPADLVLFTALNDMWKKAEESTFYAEPYWGIGGRYSPADHQ